MKTNLYSMLDSKGGIYSSPFVAIKDGIAVRSFSDLVNDGQSQVGKHPEDFSLFRIGTFDDETGIVEYKKLECLVNATSLVREGGR